MSETQDVVTLSHEGSVGIITIDSPPVNALSTAVTTGLRETLTVALGEESITSIVLICAGRTFIAGADITGFDSGAAKPTGPSPFELMEGSSKPVIAAIHGTALGGGLETALCAHYRIAVPSAKVGLPEVNLGLLPGGGGTQRLPRLTGAKAALDLIVSGRHVPARKALELGILDEIAPEDDLKQAAIALAKRVVEESLPLKTIRDRDDVVAADRGNDTLFSDFRAKNAKKFIGFKAPDAIVKCIEAAVQLPFDEGMAVEKKLFAELVSSSESAAQRYYFFAERAAAKIPDVPRETPKIPIQCVGVIGAGTMGGGIAMSFANAGIPVTIVETNQEALDRGIAMIRKNYESTAAKGRITADQVENRMALLTGTLDLNNLSQADVVIEAVFERMDVKKSVFSQLETICKPGAILASNTSALNINEIASATSRPEYVIGTHFFSPANVMKLIEVVRGDATSKEVIATVMSLAKSIGKIAVLVGVCDGFVGNRIIFARNTQSQQLLMEGASPWEIDAVLKDFGMPMGTYDLHDLAGLDIGWVKGEPSGNPIKDALCEMDRRGQKTGAGYYDYDEKRRPTPSPVTEKIIEEVRAASGIEARSISKEEILERHLLAMINEGLKILEEGMAIRASDIDVIYINGYGWPPYRGGPMFYGDQLGAATVLAKLQDYEKQFGEAFTPSPLLQLIVNDDRKISEQTAAQAGIGSTK